MEKIQKTKTARIERPATYGEAFLAIIFMLVVVTGGFIFFGLKVELLMVISAAFAALIAYRIGIGWGELEKSIVSKLSTSLPAVLIIWSIGIVIGTYVFCGSIPMIIYYGLVMVDPQYMYAFSFLTCLILSVVTGTSWGSAGTAGVALMGVAVGLDVSLPITAGAVISGAVFGDKMSPLSDTTNLSPLCAGADLYDHIRSMMWTTVPAASTLY
jgi:NhaC family Na+:H+ antiporter